MYMFREVRGDMLFKKRGTRPLFRISLLATAPALAYAAGAESQLLQMSAHSAASGASVTQPRTDCHTAVEGDVCYKMVAWAMETGVVDHPDWFVPLTKDSSFEDFQRHTAQLSDACPEPCAARAPDDARPAQLSAPEQCRTSVEGEACYKSVVWAMRAGIVANPGWYAQSGLTRNSSFEDFQRHLRGTARLSHVCPEPCAAAAPEGCHTAVEGDACYEKVVWAMQKGVVERPGWYPSLTKKSSFEDFQRFLHGEARLSHVCPEPCAPQASNAWLPAQAPAPETCHTSVEGDACYEKVVWAMQKGIAERPKWYPSLTKESSFEDFQQFLHGEARLSHVCPEPCAPPAPEECHVPAEGDTCYKMVAWAMETGIVDNPDWFTPLTRDSSFEDFQRYTAQLSDACQEPCAAQGSNARLPARAPAPEACHTSVEGEACYQSVVWAMRAGIVANPGWYARSGLARGSSFEDFQRHLHGTARLSHVCPEPCPAREATERIASARRPTPASTPAPPTPAPTEAPPTPPPTPSPTAAPTPSPPTPHFVTASGAPMQYLQVDWPCSNPGIGSQYFHLSGNSASGTPTYTNYEGRYLYYDPSCDGSGGFDTDRWIVDYDEPDATASMDLDSDGNCSYLGHVSQLTGVPLGYYTWSIACNDVIETATVSITSLESQPPLPTPAPTLEPGLPCQCEACGWFPYADLDGDGCISLAEANYRDGLPEHFDAMDADGDGCVNQSECTNYGDFPTPIFPVPPIECDYGFYATTGTSVCVPCLTGETRRRRSTECSTCPPGRTDLGDFDDCITGSWLTGPMLVNEGVARLNQRTFWDFLFEVGDCVIIRTRNPRPTSYFERFTITGMIELPNGTVILQFGSTATQPFDIYDPVTVCCGGTNGYTHSSQYPCGCGIDECYAAANSSSGKDECCIGPADPNLGSDGSCISCPAATPAPTVSAKGDPHLVNLQGEHFDVNHGGEFTLLRIPQVTSMPAEIELKASIRPEHGKPCTTYITEVELSGTSLGDKVVQVRSYSARAEGEAGKFLGLRVLSGVPRASAEAEVPWVRLEDWTDMPYLLAKPKEKDGFRMTLSKTQWRSKKTARDGAPSVAGQVEVQVQRRQYNQSAKLVMRQDLPIQEHLNLAVRQLSALGRVDIGGLLGFDRHPESLEDVTPECQRHRDGLDRQQGPHSKPAWKARWEKIKEQRGQANTPDGSVNDNEAAASLVTRAMMCVCDASADGVVGGGVAEGVLAELQTGRLGEATWD